MEVHFTPEQEAQLAQIATSAGTNAERLVKDAALRLLAGNDGTLKEATQPAGTNPLPARRHNLGRHPRDYERRSSREFEALPVMVPVSTIITFTVQPRKISDHGLCRYVLLDRPNNAS